MTTTSLLVQKEETTESIYLSVQLENPSVEDIIKTVQFIETHGDFKPGSKFFVTFSEEVSVRRDRYNKMKASEIEVKFFTASNGTFAYTFHRRSGYPLSYLDYRKIAKISYRIAKDKEKERIKTAEKILKRRYDDQTWSSLTAEGVKDLSQTIVNIKQKFPSFVIEKLTEAFENKTEFSYTKYGTKRDLSVSTKLGSDGIFRAWFSSEYAGCGNGQYYILLNPTTASFCEWD